MRFFSELTSGATEGFVNGGAMIEGEWRRGEGVCLIVQGVFGGTTTRKG